MNNKLNEEEKPTTEQRKNCPPRPKERRVGTVTLGLGLIASGVVLLASLFYPDLDLAFIAKFAPVILILLGIEILYNYFFHQKESLRFDFVSGLFCILLIATSAYLSMALPFYEKWEQRSEQEQNPEEFALVIGASAEEVK